MNSDERIYRQVEELSSSIIKALEALEKELSQYIEITDKRLHTLEDKVQKLESLVDVSSKGLVKSFEQQRESITPPLQQSTPFSQPKPVQTIPQSYHAAPPTPIIEKPTSPSVPTVHQSPPQPPHTTSEITKTPEAPSERPSTIPTHPTTPVPQSEASRFPPIPKPPSFEATLEKKPDEELLDIPERDDSIKKHEGNIAEEIEIKEKKETDKDKEELLSALKMIDNL
ncbi:MAG: hypothetical protein ACFFDW_15630 [Candidatus Thorarchaeota archaeon]